MRPAALSCLALVVLSSPAFASVSVSDVQSLLSERGARVELTERRAGDPYLDVTSGGLYWRLYFVDCGTTMPQTCTSMTMEASFSHVARKSLDVANDWNASRRFTRAFLDRNGDPNLATDFTLIDASRDAVGVSLARWTSDIKRFQDFLGVVP